MDPLARRLSIGAVGTGRQSGNSYRLLAPVARGGMGEVFLAEQMAPGGQRRQVIIKRLLENLREDASHVTMFKTEAEHLAALDHPNIVRIIDVPEVNGARCLALEYVKGRSVAQILDRARHVGQRLPPQLVLHIACEVLEGLDHVHSARLSDGKPLELVHRDVTPGNLLVSFDGEVKITDFGISKSLMSAVSTTVGIVKGKARYLAPEQILGERASPRSDLFSAGCVIYEMLTSVPLYDRVSVPKTLTAIVHGELPDLRMTLPVPTRSADLIGKTLSTDPDKRHATAKDLARDLRTAAIEMGPTSRGELASFSRNLFEGMEESWEQLPPTEDERRDAEDEASRTADDPAPPERRSAFRAASIAEEEAVSRSAKPRAEQTLLVERVRERRAAEGLPRSDSGAEGEEATLAALEDRPGKAQGSVHLSDPDHEPPPPSSDVGADIATVAEIPLRPAPPEARAVPEFEEHTEHFPEPPRRARPPVTYETEQIHADKDRPRALAYAARVESRSDPSERPIKPTEATIVKREPQGRDVTRPAGPPLSRWMAQVPAAVLIGVFALGALAGVGLTALLRMTEGPAPTEPATTIAPVPQVPDPAAEASADDPAEPPEANEPDPVDVVEPSPATMVATKDQATLDLILPKTAKIRLDGENLARRAPVHGLVIAPGRHEVVVTIKKWRRQAVFEVQPGSHHKLDVEELKRIGTP